jgi:SAM-dependent methyltransferase
MSASSCSGTWRRCSSPAPERGYAHGVSGRRRDLADHRDYVGPREQYDVIGAGQFTLLHALGLRAHHRVLDLGCGSLRAGRLLIPYLDPGGYTGVDPNRWLIDRALDEELGRDLVALKRPRFDPTDDFDLAHLGRFDIVLAHGIATNTGPRTLHALLAAIRDTLDADGLGAITVIHPGEGDPEAVPVSITDPTVPDWRYPGCYAYARTELRGAIDDAGLTGRELEWRHPRHRWWLLAHDPQRLDVDPIAALTAPPEPNPPATDPSRSSHPDLPRCTP